jgi:formate hydrogenlyase subunit 6/NADH:ubiquinone oxidoreductase subunit I/uncharacterized protein YkuJ
LQLPKVYQKEGRLLETFVPKAKVPDLVKHLQKEFKVIAPTAKGPAFVFAEIEDPALVVLDYPTTVLPPKKFFMPSKEDLVKFNRVTGDAKAPEVKFVPKAFLGLHNYDVQGILRLDLLMKEGNPDKTYLARREGCVFIGVTYTPDENHFSPSVGIPADMKEGFDAFLTPADGGYNLSTLTPAGEKALKGFAGAGNAKPAANGVAAFSRKISPELPRVPAILDKAYGSDIWTSVGEKCLSCGSCNLVCPTCYCFDVEDDVSLNLADGTRQRMWDGCQLSTFAMVAGGENFREKRGARCRHRVYRKFRYMNSKSEKPFCVGCGRCNRACTAKINIVEMLNDAAAAV